ncbi:MAG: ribonuclease HII [Gammaproteobacteria bacterium]
MAGSMTAGLPPVAAASDIFTTIGGVDEAGRGPLAGPVVAAVVVLASTQRIDGVRDSKQLSARRRERLFDVIRSDSIAWAVGEAGVDEIDELNILHAAMLAMRRAVGGLAVAPARLRVDGNRAPVFKRFAGVTQTVIGGDRVCPAIAAASIMAKVVRDRAMLALDERFPLYGFARNKGYPTREHRHALARHGPCPAHRRSFRPVRLALESRGAGR